MDVVLIFDGNYNDRNLNERIFYLQKSISQLTNSECAVLKVEPWNSVKVTFSIPSKAAKQLKELALNNSNLLNELEVISVQVEGEDVIRLAVDSGDGNTQEVVVQQNASLIQQHNGAQQHMFNHSALAQDQAANNSQLPPPVTKKRNRKSKDKQTAKSSKSGQNKTGLPAKADQPSTPVMLKPSDVINQESPQYSLTQLSPSVEEIVTEVWDQEMHRQHLEEDIMDIQLQSFSSGANVSTGNGQGILNSSFDQQALHSVIPKHHQHSPGDLMHTMPTDLQKQHSVPNNFAPGMAAMSASQKVFSNQSGSATMGVNNVSHPSQDSAIFNQQINQQGMNADLSQSPQISNMPGNYQGNNLQASNNHYVNVAPQTQWSSTSMMQVQPHVYKIQSNNNQGTTYLQHTNQPQANMMSSQSNMLSSQGNLMSSQSSMMTSQGHASSQSNMISQNSMTGSQNNLIQNPLLMSQSNLMTPQSPMLTPQNNLMTPPESMSPAVASQHQFPFSYPHANKQQVPGHADMRPDKMQALQQNMSMESPLLVTLLQNEAASSGAGLTSPTQFAPSVPAPTNQKPKRKKPTRKKKPPKTTSTTPPTVTGPMHAMGGIYPMQGQYGPQQYATGDMPNPEQMLQQQQQNNIIKTSFPNSKTPSIDTMSEVGAHPSAYPSEAVPTEVSNLRPHNQQVPMLRRNNSYPVPRAGVFPPGFDPNKGTPYAHKQHPNISPHQQQQQMYMSQMSNPYPGYKPGPSRPMMIQPQQMMQQQGESNQLQYQPSNFQPGGVAQMTIMPQQVTRPQHYPPNRHQQPPQMQNQGGFQQPMSHPGGMKSPAPHPLMHQQRPVHQPSAHHTQKRPTLVGRLSNGAMSIMMKASCQGSTAPERAAPTLPTLSRAQSSQARKSPASSMDSISSSPKMGHPSPKVNHPNAPSPQINQSYNMNAPSPMGAPTNNKGGPSQSRPRSRNFAPSKSAPRRPSFDQYSNIMPGTQQNRGYPNTGNPPFTVSTGMASPPTGMSFQPANVNKKVQESYSMSEIHPERPTGWQQTGMMANLNPGSYNWQGPQPVPPSPVQSYPPPPIKPATQPPESLTVHQSLPTKPPTQTTPPGVAPQAAVSPGSALLTSETTQVAAGENLPTPSIASEVKNPELVPTASTG